MVGVILRSPVFSRVDEKHTCPKDILIVTFNFRMRTPHQLSPLTWRRSLRQPTMNKSNRSKTVSRIYILLTRTLVYKRLQCLRILFVFSLLHALIFILVRVVKTTINSPTPQRFSYKLPRKIGMKLGTVLAVECLFVLPMRAMCSGHHLICVIGNLVDAVWKEKIAT